MAQTIRSVKAQITLANLSSGAPGVDSNRLDWVKDWDGDGVVVSEQKIALPSVFAGTIEENDKGEKGLVGVALGKNVFEENPYSVGLAVYNTQAEPTIKIMTNGSATFGREEGRQLLVRTNGTIVTPKIRVTDLDPEFIPNLDLSYNISLPGMLYSTNSHLMFVRQEPESLHFRVTLARDSHLMGHFVMNGYANEDMDVTVNLKMNNTYAPFCPLVQTVKKGAFFITIPCAFSFVPSGVNYAFVELSCSNGLIDIGLFDIEFGLEGKYMLEATSVKAPHAEVEQTYYPTFIDYGLDSVNISITNALIDEVNSADIIEVTRSLVEETYVAIDVDRSIPNIQLVNIKDSGSEEVSNATDVNGNFAENGSTIVIEGNIIEGIKKQGYITEVSLFDKDGRYTDVIRAVLNEMYNFDKYTNINFFEPIRRDAKQYITFKPLSTTTEINEPNKILETDFYEVKNYISASNDICVKEEE